MSSMLDQPPQRLQAFDNRLSCRYGALDMSLLDVPGHWMVLRTAALAVGLESALIDVEPSSHHTMEALAEMDARAEFGVGDDATLVMMYLARLKLSAYPSHAAGPMPVPAITVRSLAHPMALTGYIELDEASAPIWIELPTALSRTGSRDAHGLRPQCKAGRQRDAPPPRTPCRAAPADRSGGLKRPHRDPSDAAAAGHRPTTPCSSPGGRSWNPRPAQRPFDRPPGGQPGRPAPRWEGAAHAAGARVRSARP
jgi:hypothetical protein